MNKMRTNKYYAETPLEHDSRILLQKIAPHSHLRKPWINGQLIIDKTKN